MVKRITVTGLLVAAAAMLLAGGCGPSTDLSGTPIPNSLPDTRVTARPPDVLEAGFVVQFYWTGEDPDGRVAGFQWKMSDNGTDGISVQDTLTFDPVTGDTLNPWVFTASTDSTFLVSADVPDFPGDPEGYDRSYQTHTFLVRAVDEDGGVDPTPALVSFTSTTLLPTVRVTGPLGIGGSQRESVRVPLAATFLFEGEDSDFEAGIPTSYRYLWKRAILPSGGYADSKLEFDNNIDYLVDFEDSTWTDWVPYEPNDDLRRVALDPQQERDAQGNIIQYLFALQVRDTAGAVSIDRRYGLEVANVYVTTGISPFLRVSEQFLGEFTGSGRNLVANLDVAAGQELNFSWVADASGYAGEIVSYRYGWDVADLTDPNDPNWALPPGNSSQHRRSPAISFASGVHTLTIQVVDNSNQLTQMVITLNVVPVPDPDQQLPLLLLDDIPDQDSRQWPNNNGTPLDRDEFRDQFWLAVLEGRGGVSGFQPAIDVVDTEDNQVEYREAVNYQTLLWTTRWVSSPQNTIATEFRPGISEATGDLDQYVWLTPYQESVGNVLLAGSQALNAFLSEAAYELPIVFQSREGNPRSGFTSVGQNVTVRRGFGERELPDGTTVRVGLTRYPYQTAGIATLDVMSPGQSYYEYGLGLLVKNRRKNACVAMQALVIDPQFKANYMPSGNVFPDTIYSDPDIVWWDDPYTPRPGNVPASDVLNVSYVWSQDEFYDADIIQRGTPYQPQESPAFDCDGLCVEPMFRSLARFNWVRHERLADDPDDTWPQGYYGGPGQQTLDGVCGPRSLNQAQTSALTNDQVVAFIARKTAPQKPSQVGDVVMGFDPYRFDNTEMTKVIRWVLGEHFGLAMNP